MLAFIYIVHCRIMATSQRQRYDFFIQKMRQFSISLKQVTTKRSMNNHCTLCLLLNIRSQKTCSFQKELSAFLDSHGTSRSGLNSGPVLGYGKSPRTTDRHKKLSKQSVNKWRRWKSKKQFRYVTWKQSYKQVDATPFVFNMSLEIFTCFSFMLAQVPDCQSTGWLS